MKTFTVDLYLVTDPDYHCDDKIIRGSRLRIHIRGSKKLAAFRPIHDFERSSFMKWTVSCFTQDVGYSSMNEFDCLYNFERVLIGSEKVKALSKEEALHKVIEKLNAPK